MTAEHQRAIREAEARGAYREAADLRVKAALGETADRSEPRDSRGCHEQASTFPAARAQAIGLELIQLSNSIQRDLSRAQTLLGEMRGIAYQLEKPNT